MVKENWLDRHENDIFCLLLPILIGGLVYGVTVFYSGYHNIDLAFNEQYVVCSLSNYSLDDIEDVYNSDGDTKLMTDFYILGMEQIRYGFYLCMTFMFLLGIVVYYFTEKNEK